MYQKILYDYIVNNGGVSTVRMLRLGLGRVQMS